MSISVRFGPNNSVSRDLGVYPTVRHIMSDDDLQQFLGFGDNVEARVNGASVDADTNLIEGDIVDLVSVANTKGL